MSMRWRAAVCRLTCSALFVLGAAACGGSAAMRAQGARYSRIPDPDERAYRGKKPVVVLLGEATYYSDDLAGNHTASGDRYDPSRMTAASRDLPFESIVRVTRRDTRAQVLVRINDRGPFGKRHRILDLSRAAARKLGILKLGFTEVRAEVLVLGSTKTERHDAGAAR